MASGHVGILGKAGGDCEFVDPLKDLAVGSPTRKRLLAEMAAERALSPQRAGSGWNATKGRISTAVGLNAIAKPPPVEKPPRPLEEILEELQSLPVDSCEGSSQRIEEVRQALAKTKAVLNDQELELLRLQAEVGRKQKVLTVYETREAELYAQLEGKDQEIDAVDDEADDHARNLTKREEELTMRSKDLELREERERKKIADKQVEWDRRLMHMEKGIEKKRAQLKELEAQLDKAGLGGHDVQEKFREDVEARLVYDVEQLTALTQELDRCEEEKETLFTSLCGPLGKLLKKEIQIHRRNGKLRLTKEILIEQTHQEHVYRRELAELKMEEEGYISTTDESEDEHEDEDELLLPEGWTVEHLVFVKMVKHDPDLQVQLTAVKEWWGNGVQQWRNIEAHILETWGWDASQLHFLDAEVDASKIRADDGALKQVVRLKDFLQVFRTAVEDSGRNVAMWKAFR